MPTTIPDSPPRATSRCLAQTRRFELLLEHRAGEQVAVKQLRTDRLVDERAAGRLRAEAATLRRFEHPGIVRMLELEDRTARPRLVLEWLEGPTLADHLRLQGRLREPQALALVVAVASALAHVHDHGLVHADVKPRNLILTGRGPVLLDFDLARAPGRVGGSLGTRLFRAPEQARCEAVEPASDIWSLGVILYRAIAGRLPFSGPGLPQLDSPQHVPARPLPPCAARELVGAMLDPDPAGRPAALDVAAAATRLRAARAASAA